MIQTNGKRETLFVSTAQGLRDGLGVEDIAIKHGLDVRDVRAEVARLRRIGVVGRLRCNQRKGAGE
ncbi:hypothetical protein BMI86_10180 [Thioclava sp. DLFJ5-1]|uniref:hypothetical protein n=1 Tax=Thioclava sp. DLFJ5-1 TaxID=1915314 RepID=UPI000996A062|nr:hypothetical protein [Thioclava sp. DLFJ5-1]OOY20865.1 hypothetical protein BMI86_10180 [Thioclava sp. DLFJ5-1]